MFASLSHGLDVRLSVRVFVTPLSPIKTVKTWITKSSLWSASRLKFLVTKFCAPGWGDSPRTRASKRGIHPQKSRYFAAIGSYSGKVVADMYRLAAYHNKHRWRAF